MLHWADEIARSVVAKNPNATLYTCASGISPSGPVHMGNLREIITTFFVAKGLRDLGKKVRFIYSWDEYDRLRKVPAGVNPDFAKYIGVPYSQVPDPFGCHASYAEHFEAPVVEALKELGIDVEYIHQAKRYTNGDYAEGIMEALKKRKQIYDIQYRFKTQEAKDEDREKYYPIEIYCEKCGKDTTHITGQNEDCSVLDYTCQCGFEGKIDLHKQFHCKLPWKVDWPMRWREEKVLFEPGGRDHSSEGGSYQVSSVIAKEIFNIEPPYYQMYDFINLKGQTKKISSSAGTSMLPEIMLKVYSPEIILWMYTRFVPEKAFDLALDQDVLRMYHEFDRMYAKYKDGSATDIEKRIMELSLAGRPANFEPVSASLIASFAPIVNFDLDMLVDLMNKCGEKVTKERVEDRFYRIKYWMENYCPEEIVKLLDKRNDEFYSNLNDEEKGWIKTLVTEMKSKDMTLTEMQTLLYEIPKLDGEENKQRQKRFFEVVYNLLLGKTKGPRLYLFLAAVDKNSLIKLLEF